MSTQAKTLREMFPKQPTLYSLDVVDALINRYIEKGGEMITLEEGCLGYGLTVLIGDGLKTSIITEVYLNEWSSAHKIRMYNKCPKKYQKMIDEYYEREDDDYE